jgi:hypothetical protein
MAKKAQSEDAAAAIRRLTIVQLGLAGVSQTQIRKIVGGGINEVNAIVKLLKKKKRGGN